MEDKSMAIMRKFSRLATLVNRKRQNPFSFLYPIYVPNETEFKALEFYDPFERLRWIYFFPQPESTTVSLHRPSFSPFRCLNPRPRPRTPKGEAKRKETTTFLHPATTRLRGTRSNYRSYIPSFFPPTFSCSLCYDHRERGGEVVYFSARSRGWRGWRRLPFAGQFAILNHRLSGWYPLSSYSMFALSCAMSSLCSFHACLLFPINPPRDKQIFSNAKIDTTTYCRWYVIAVEGGGRIIKNCTVLLLSRLYMTSEEYFRTREYNGRYCFNWTQMYSYVCSFWLFNICHIAL